MNKKEIKIWFTYFWGKFDKFDNLFTWILSHKYNVVVTDNNPDIVITLSSNERYQNAIMVHYSGEPFFNIGVCDYAITSFYSNEDSRFFRVPLYLLYNYDYFKIGYLKSYQDLVNNNRNPIEILQNKNKFCSFISQGGGYEGCIRTRFFHNLSNYKKIDSAGSYLNNHVLVNGEAGTIEGSVNKTIFLKNYKFTIAMENRDFFNEYHGYTTEKIFEPFVANSIPIYWGNKSIDKDFNTNAFINWNDFGSDEKVIEQIIKIDNDDNLFMDYLSEKIVVNNDLFTVEYTLDIFDKIIKI
jgi:hypothetical protein